MTRTIEQVIDLAHARSVRDECTTHVNARVRLVRGATVGSYTHEVSYSLSDWFCSDSTVYTAHPDGTGECS